MDVLNKIFELLTTASSKLPKIQVGAGFIIVLLSMFAVGFIIGLTYLASQSGRLIRACQKIKKYLANVDEINDDNAEEFTSQCFGKTAPSSLRDTWIQYLGVRFGYPSEIISEKAVVDKEIKRVKNIRANIFIAIALILDAIFAFWSLGSNPSVEMGAIVGFGLLWAGAIYLVLIVLSKKQYNKAVDIFYDMEDDLDAKVDFHVEKDYAMDASPLQEMIAILDEVIAKNTGKVVKLEDIEKDANADNENTDNDEVNEENTESDDESANATDEDNLTPENDGDTATEENAQDDTSSDEPSNVQNEDESETPIEQMIDGNFEPETIVPEGDEIVDGNASEDEVSTEEIVENAVDEETDENTDVEETNDDAEVSEEDAIGNISDYINSVANAQTMASDEDTSEIKNDGVDDWLAGQNEFGKDTPMETFEEVNIEDDNVMFGRKKKEALKAQQAAEQAAQQVYLESEVVEDEEVEPAEEPVKEVEPTPAPVQEPVQAQQQAPVQEPAQEFKRTVNVETVGKTEPDVVEEYEDLDEGDEDIKAPRLSKLPHLVDYVLSMNVSRGTKIKVAQLMFQAYAVFKNSPENKAIVTKCISKIMTSIASEKR